MFARKRVKKEVAKASMQQLQCSAPRVSFIRMKRTKRNENDENHRKFRVVRAFITYCIAWANFKYIFNRMRTRRQNTLTAFHKNRKSIWFAIEKSSSHCDSNVFSLLCSKLKLMRCVFHRLQEMKYRRIFMFLSFYALSISWFETHTSFCWVNENNNINTKQQSLKNRAPHRRKTMMRRKRSLVPLN